MDGLIHSFIWIQGPFFNVYALKQPWLDYNIFFCPEAKPDDGILYLVIMDCTWNHWTGAKWMLNSEMVTIFFLALFKNPFIFRLLM